MADIFSKAKRSDVMSRIRSRGNAATELALAKLLRRHGITGWRRQQRVRINVQRPTSNVERSTLSVGRWKFFSVRPDFVFPKRRVAVFVDGCFWHGCPKHATQPKGNAAFWRKKFSANKARDRRVTRELRRAGWRVLRIWEHELAKIKLCSTPHPSAQRKKSVRRTSSGLRPPSPQSGEGNLPVRGGEGAEARLLARLRRALS